MREMKCDMAGGAAVIACIKGIAELGLQTNVTAIVPATENMPALRAQRPGDVVKTMSGKTIEIDNTDAEGRLVLADILWFTKERFKPKFMVNLATLTGAIIISLGNQYAGLFSNNDTLSDRLTQAGNEVNEPLWRMPISSEYDKMINSDVADMKNIGGRGAGSITAAQFLNRFVGKVPWAHLDIAGVTWSKASTSVVPIGGTAFGVRLLDRLVRNHYERR